MRIPPFCPSRPAPPRSDLHVASKKIGAGLGRLSVSLRSFYSPYTSSDGRPPNRRLSYYRHAHSFWFRCRRLPGWLLLFCPDGLVVDGTFSFWLVVVECVCVCVWHRQTSHPSLLPPLPIPPAPVFLYSTCVRCLFLLFISPSFLRAVCSRTTALRCAICIPRRKRKIDTTHTNVQTKLTENKKKSALIPVQIRQNGPFERWQIVFLR
jgi:hypothetical protein